MLENIEYNVGFRITVKGIEYPLQYQYVIVKPNQTVYNALVADLKKYGHAMCLPKNYTVTIVSRQQICIC